MDGGKIVKRGTQTLLVAAAVLTLLSCDYLLSPLRGRWNLLDPKQELVEFTPLLDGYVTSGGWQDGGDVIANAAASIILIRFDTSGFPAVVNASYLRLLKVSSNMMDPTLEIYRIIQPWDGSITLTSANNPGVFYDDQHQQRVGLLKGDTEVVVPLTNAFSGMRSALEWGIIIFAPVELVQFEGSEGSVSPLLLIEPG